jgi:hypothetical protein
MATNQSEGFLLFIEPKNQKSTPIIDKYTKKMTGAFNQFIAKGGSNYSHGSVPEFREGLRTKGWHTCSCGAISSNMDYLLKTKDSKSVGIHKNSSDFFTGKEIDTTPQFVITNSLCIHYVACHRDEISKEILEQILFLEGDEQIPTPDQIDF